MNMRRLLPMVAVGAVVVGAIFIDLSTLEPPVIPPGGIVNCPAYFDDAATTLLPQKHPASRWEVYAEDGVAGTGKVKVTASPLSTDSMPYSCELKIISAPYRPGKGADWRIGHAIKPDGFRGRNIEFRVAIRSEPDITLDNGQVYVYDGANVSGAAVASLTSQWKVLSVRTQINPAADVFELWFRLLIDSGTVRPSAGTIYFVPQLKITSSQPS